MLPERTEPILTSTLHGPAIQAYIKLAASKTNSIQIAAPFWGEHAIDLLGLEKVVDRENPSFRLICNLESGACNPAPIKVLKNRLLWSMRTNKRLHAKVYIFDDCAIVGSANPSANGLALQDTEANSWHEVCIVVSDRKDVRGLRRWFDRLFASSESKSVTPTRLAIAEALWKQRRRDTGNIFRRSAISLKDLAEGEQGASVLESTWIWIYSDPNVSNESQRYNSRIKREYGNLHSDPYEVPSDPRRYGYDTIVDCFYEGGAKARARVYVSQYRLHPQLTKRLDKGVSKGYWTLPCSSMSKADVERKLLDAESVDWIQRMVEKKLESEESWEGTLKELILETKSLTNRR
jgi:hypothetical protein